MPITCTRNSSTRRCRRSTRPASFSPDDVSRTPLYGSYSARPDSARALIIVVAVPGVTPSELATCPIGTSRSPRGSATWPW